MPLSHQPLGVNGVKMCLILFSYAQHPGYRLILLANRDEFYDRPTRPLGPWPEAPHIYGGRDLKGSGTWFGVTRGGRLAAVTNYRDRADQNPQAPSRGLLTSRFLKGAESPRKYLEKVRADGHRYNGFNLLVGDRKRLWYYSNRGEDIVPLDAGVFGLSNHLLDTAWPKIVSGKQSLKKVLSRGKSWHIDDLFEVLSDRSVASDDRLPDTGVGIEWERLLSPLFITSPGYGTRSSTVLLISDAGEVTVEEHSFEPNTPPVGNGKACRRQRFVIDPSCR